MTHLALALSPSSGPWASIDPHAISWNLAWLRRRLLDSHAAHGSPPPRLWAVLKANAYGHGLELVVPALQEADGAAVAYPADILRLRKAGWARPILLLSSAGLDFSLLSDPSLGELHLVIDDARSLQSLEHLKKPLPKVHLWLRYAGRLRAMGFDDTEYPAAFERLHGLTALGVVAGAGHLHHYASAEDPAVLAEEEKAFNAVTAGLPGPRCTGNSASLCSHRPVSEGAAGHWLRCGLALYGASAIPGTTGPQLGLRPAMSLRAPLLSIRRVCAGQTVGYGDSFRAAHDTCIGVVGVGYGHGVPRRLWQHGKVLAGKGGRPVPLAGRVAMDCLTVDLGSAPVERVGDVMTLWGRADEGALLPVETVAESCETIAAELLTALTGRVPLVPAG